MVAKIESGKSLTGAFHYNENKVETGKAYLLGTNGYTKSDHLLSFNDKLFRLTDLAGRNIRTKTNTLHLSLNFDVTEKLDNEMLLSIANEYMKRIGFKKQPYLVYKHLDAGHPHIHVLTTNIQPDGKRISLNNIGKLKSEPARKAIEIEFGLVKASGKDTALSANEEFKLKPVNYGKSDTKRSIANIVTNIVKQYKFTSIPELNAVLNLYNVTACRGTKESVMYKNGGLNYWVIDENGNRIGVPIKASSLYKKPTLKLLEGRFELNQYLRKPLRDSLKIKIDKAMAKCISLEQFKKELKLDAVNIVVRKNTDGRIYGLTFIDQANKVVFNGRDIGTNYSAAAILKALHEKPIRNNVLTANASATTKTHVAGNASLTYPTGLSLLDDLLKPHEVDQGMPSQFGPRKRKKKRRNLNL
jgi:hypothetical protein